MCALETAQEKFGVFLKPTRTLLELRTSQQSHREHRGCPATEPGGRAQTGPNPAPSTLVPCPKVPGGLCCAGGAGHRRSLPPGTEGAPRLPPHCAPSTRSHLGVPKAPQHQEEPRARSGGSPAPAQGKTLGRPGRILPRRPGVVQPTASSPGGRFPPRSRGAGGQKLPSCPGWPRSPCSRWPVPIPVGVQHCLLPGQPLAAPSPFPRPEPGKGLRPPHPSQNAGLSIWVPSAAVCSRPLPQP